MPDYVATEVKTALEAAGYKITVRGHNIVDRKMSQNIVDK